MEDDQQVERACTDRTRENIVAVQTTLATDHQLMILKAGRETLFDKEIMRKIVTEDIGKKKLCAQFVLHALTVEQREDCTTSCQYLLEMLKKRFQIFK